jgi:hypothetical protein
MPKILIITFVTLLANLTAIGQNLFIIGERSYPSTDAMTFESNADNGYDLVYSSPKKGNSDILLLVESSPHLAKSLPENSL